MSGDLDAPLGRRPAPRPGLPRPLLPVAALLCGIVLAIGLLAWLILAGGDHSAPASADIALRPPVPAATITAGPEIPADGLTVIAGDLPDASGADPAAGDIADAAPLPPALVEDSPQGPLPRIAANGETPFSAYARPSLTPGTADGKRLIAVVLTGLGLNAAGTANAIDTLPATISLAFAPYGDDLAETAARARGNGHELLLEVPLEPFGYPVVDPGPDTLLLAAPPAANLDRLRAVMARLGGYVGIVNHMGARFTASAEAMAPVMDELAARGLAFLDDGSSAQSAAAALAGQRGMPFARAALNLDEHPERPAILDRLAALEAEATRSGAAIGVVSALPVSIATLAEWAAKVEEKGYVLVPVSALMTSTP